MYNETVPPVILDGGKDILLANCQGPRSLKCTSVNGGLAKPAPEHTYAVVDREFLCDCQLDLEHASVLRQLSSCNRERSSKLVMQFHVNIAFWELLRERSPQTAELTIHLSQCVNTAIAIDSQWERLSAVTLGQA